MEARVTLLYDGSFQILNGQEVHRVKAKSATDPLK